MKQSLNTLQTLKSDYEFLLNFTKVISEEIILDNLLGVFLNGALKNAGADKGLLILKSKDDLFIDAKTTSEQQEADLTHIPLDSWDEYSITAVQYTLRTKKPLLIQCSDKPVQFMYDRYLKKYDSISVLIIPILYQGDLLGLLYLENKLVRNAFTEKTVRTLSLISSQAAISIKNARLYLELKKSEEKHRYIIENAIDGIYRITVKGKLLSTNPSLASILGYSETSELLKSVRDFRTQVFADHEEWKEFEKILFQEEKIKGMETQFLCKNGNMLWVFINARLVSKFESGEYVIEGFVKDVNERKLAELGKDRMEKALKESFNEIKVLKDRLQEENIYLRDEIRTTHNFDEIIGQSDAFRKVLENIEMVASTDASVLILGETGTGKELVARTVHNISLRRNKPLVKVNCAALPENLIESELFGHEKGAFTGAVEKKIGRFELADKGTVFLDEIGELPLGLQAKLLRVLQEGEIERLGNPRTISIDTRIIAATNRDLEKAIQNSTFREDLYYRLNVFPIVVPPLRERKKDIPLLVRFFIDTFNKKIGKSIDDIPFTVMEKLNNYHWPGNIRELENIIERSVIISRGKKLELGPWLSLKKTATQKKSFSSLRDNEKYHILNVLKSTNWKISGESGAAKILDLKRTTLEARMKKLNISRYE
ncbi:MAG: sigma 54-interacting transcriptional regulator [Chitinispirillia bacterium]|jgi:PAS domain S-box-containing protein